MENNYITYAELTSNLLNVMADEQNVNPDIANKIQAIKRLRQLTGLGLREAKDYVDQEIKEREKARNVKSLKQYARNGDVRSFLTLLSYMLNVDDLYDMRETLIDIRDMLPTTTTTTTDIYMSE